MRYQTDKLSKPRRTAKTQLAPIFRIGLARLMISEPRGKQHTRRWLGAGQWQVACQPARPPSQLGKVARMAWDEDGMGYGIRALQVYREGMVLL